MGISLSNENDLRMILKDYKENHRIRNTVVIIMTVERTIIDTLDRKTFKSLSSEASYGIGFKDGRNDYFKELSHKKKKYTNRLDLRQ